MNEREVIDGDIKAMLPATDTGDMITNYVMDRITEVLKECDKKAYFVIGKQNGKIEQLQQENEELKEEKAIFTEIERVHLEHQAGQKVEIERLTSQLKTAVKTLKHCHEFFAKTPFHETEYLHPITRDIVDNMYDETEQALKELEEE